MAIYKRILPFPERDVKANPPSIRSVRQMPRLFRHQDVIDSLESAKPIKNKNLSDILNHINFVGGHILVQLHHPKYKESILVEARPDPCLGKELTCTWSDDSLSDVELETYEFRHLLIDDGRTMIVVPVIPNERNGRRFTVDLPPNGYAVGKRQSKRFACRELAVVLDQSGFLAKGTLLDFCLEKFRVRVRPEKFCSFHWFNSDEPVMTQLRDNERVVFSGLCRCIREGSGIRAREFVLSPVNKMIRRFKKGQVRNPRQRLSPSPKLIFDHPFLQRRIQLDVSDISTTGFSVYENVGDGVLVQGMIIPEVVIEFAGTSRIRCSAQVIYRLEEDEKRFRYALSILDMDINSYSKLNRILGSALDTHTHISNRIDMDDLWEFFFETGFIYPNKYGLVESHRADFKETYQKLYQENPEIARHFTYEKDGRICAHMSMVKAYERTWLLQHHAARPKEGRLAGFMVLKQIMLFLSDLHRLPSTKSDYLMSYFRPESKFPDRIYGGFARDMKNPKWSSLDLFSYLPYTVFSIGARLPAGWTLREFSRLDTWDLSLFYECHSGGLLLDILGLDQPESVDKSLEDLYEKSGFVRTWRAFSLTQEGRLMAVLIANRSDLGLNLSELLNGIKILVIDQETLTWDILSAAIGQLAPFYRTNKVPLLIYPSEYVTLHNIPCGKQYLLWISDNRSVVRFKEFLERTYKISCWK